MAEILLAVLAAALLAAGSVFGVYAMVGTRKTARPAARTLGGLRRWWQGPTLSPTESRRRRIVLTIGLAAGAVVWLVTSWPLAGIIVAVAVPGVPFLLASSAAERRALARLEALEGWTRRVGDYVGNGIGLQQALVAAARTAPHRIGPAARRLAARLQASMPAEQALRLFADEFDDASCDEVLAPLILHLSSAGEGLGDALQDLASTLAEDIASRDQANAERSAARFTVRFLTGATVLVLAIGGFSPGLSQPYRDLTGSVVLLGLAGLYVVLMLWIRALTLPERVPRLMTTSPTQVGS
jgi:Flp pilus assembly protein TadB